MASSGWVIFYFILPETRGTTLENVEQIFLQPLCQNSRRKPEDEDAKSDRL